MQLLHTKAVWLGAICKTKAAIEVKICHQSQKKKLIPLCEFPDCKYSLFSYHTHTYTHTVQAKRGKRKPPHLIPQSLLRERLPGHTNLAAALVWRQSEWLRGETVPLRGSGLEPRWPVVVQAEPNQGINDMGAYSLQPLYQSMGERGRDPGVHQFFTLIDVVYVLKCFECSRCNWLKPYTVC